MICNKIKIEFTISIKKSLLIFFSHHSFFYFIFYIKKLKMSNYTIKNDNYMYQRKFEDCLNCPPIYLPDSRQYLTQMFGEEGYFTFCADKLFVFG